jgi:hypothetical protein
MKTICSLLFAGALACVPATAQRQCTAAQHSIVPVDQNTSRVRVSTADPNVFAFEIHIKYLLKTESGNLTKRTMQWVWSDANGAAIAEFNTAAEQITEVTVLCTTGGQK